MFVYSYDSLGGYVFFYMKLLGKKILYEYADSVGLFLHLMTGFDYLFWTYCVQKKQEMHQQT